MKSLLAAFTFSLSALSFAAPINNPPAYYEGTITKATSNLGTTCGITVKKLKKADQLEIKVNAFGVFTQRLLVPTGTIALTLNTYTEVKPFAPVVVSVKLVDSRPVNFTATLDLYGEKDSVSCKM